MKESLRYLHNAQDILKSAPAEDHIYTDVKPVQEACGTAYLAVLKAIDEYLLKRGVEKKKLPRSVDGYRQFLKKYGAIHNGKLLKNFEDLYEELHIAGYYHGHLRSVGTVREALKTAKEFIDKLGS
jgi:hypothetical protein